MSFDESPYPATDLFPSTSLFPNIGSAVLGISEDALTLTAITSDDLSLSSVSDDALTLTVISVNVP